jgi:hypothetical protein
LSSVVELVEYELRISTGEVLRVSELDPERIADGPTRAYVESGPACLARCTRATRETVEHAKLGHDAPLRKALLAPPAAMLQAVAGRPCSERRTCLSWDSSACTSDGYRVGRKLKLMPCWAYEGVFVEEMEVMSVVVAAWFDGRTVVVIGEPTAPARPGARPGASQPWG